MFCVHNSILGNSTVLSLPVPICALQKKSSDALHMEECAMTNNDDGNYGLLFLPHFKHVVGRNELLQTSYEEHTKCESSMIGKSTLEDIPGEKIRADQ